MVSHKRRRRRLSRWQSGCLFSWNRDPATGLICIQSGPQWRGVHIGLPITERLDWNACCGDDRQDTPGVFFARKGDQEICRELRVSRKVVRKVIRSNATEFHYERSQQPLPRIGPWRERLEALLDENDSRAARERLTLIRILRSCSLSDTRAATRRSGAMQSLGERSVQA
jgi:hypothetical protein